MQRRKKIYSTIYTSLGLLGLWFFLQDKKLPLSEEVAPQEPKTIAPAISVGEIPKNPNIVEAPTPNWRPKTSILISILESKNDNDPRYDTVLKTLDEEDKIEFKRLYRSIALEKRNDRGTIVFLLGRNIQTKEDLVFFQEVLVEPKCLSLSNCKKPTKDNAKELTLVYPQIMALNMLKGLVGQSDLSTQAIAILSPVTKDSDPRVAGLAKKILEKSDSLTN